MYATNCIGQGSTTAAFNIFNDGVLTQLTNVTSGATFAVDGYHLSAVVAGTYTDMSATYTDDIDGDTWATWGPGCDFYPVATASRVIITSFY